MVTVITGIQIQTMLLFNKSLDLGLLDCFKNDRYNHHSDR